MRLLVTGSVGARIFLANQINAIERSWSRPQEHFVCRDGDRTDQVTEAQIGISVPNRSKYKFDVFGFLLRKFQKPWHSDELPCACASRPGNFSLDNQKVLRVALKSLCKKSRAPLVLAAVGTLLFPTAFASAQTFGPPQGHGNPPQGPGSAVPGGPNFKRPKMIMLAPLPVTKDVPPSPDPRNFEGNYTAEPGGPLAAGPGAAPLPFTAATAKQQARIFEMNAKGTPLGGEAALCRPGPDFHVGADLFPGLIVQTADKVVLLNEEHRTRWVVYLNRRHPNNLRPTYWGDSVGRWDGNTLVVDTIGFNGKNNLLSAKAHVVTRIRKIEGGYKLEFETTKDDPVNFTRPVTNRDVSIWNPGQQILEFQCEENLEGAKEGLVIGK